MVRGAPVLDCGSLPLGVGVEGQSRVLCGIPGLALSSAQDITAFRNPSQGWYYETRNDGGCYTRETLLALFGKLYIACMSPTRLQLKELRAWKGWSQAELARRAGIDRVATISDYENGKVSLLNMSTLEKLATALGVQVGQLFLEERASTAKRQGK